MNVAAEVALSLTLVVMMAACPPMTRLSEVITIPARAGLAAAGGGEIVTLAVTDDGTASHGHCGATSGFVN